MDNSPALDHRWDMANNLDHKVAMVVLDRQAVMVNNPALDHRVDMVNNLDLDLWADMVNNPDQDHQADTVNNLDLALRAVTAQVAQAAQAMVHTVTLSQR